MEAVGTGLGSDWCQWRLGRSWESKVERGRVAGLTAALGCGVVVGSKATAFMMNLLQVVCDHWVHLSVPMGFVFGCYLDRKNDEKLTAFWNKSLLLIYIVYINI